MSNQSNPLIMRVQYWLPGMGLRKWVEATVNDYDVSLGDRNCSEIVYG